MDPPPLKAPSTPAMPLFPLSPERVNGTRPPYGAAFPQSPSLPEFGAKSTIEPSALFSNSASSSPHRHSRNNSEALVQGMVARFDSLSIKDYRQRDEVLVKRLEMSKELAELEKEKAREKLQDKEEEVRKWREEVRRLKKEVEEGRDRERKLMRRVGVATEQAENIKSSYDHHVGVFEREIKRTRKEAFKSSSSLVKLQEELKSTRNSLSVVRQQLDLEKNKSAKYEQEAFSSQYKLVGVQEELQKALERISVIEQERDSLKTSFQEEEISRIAAEGRIALPLADKEDDDLASTASPFKSPRKRSPLEGDDKENMLPPKQKLELNILREELAIERQLRERAQDQVEFMKMECQFQCCSCRIAESQGQRYIHDSSMTELMELIKESVPQTSTAINFIDSAPPSSLNTVDEPDISSTLLGDPEPVKRYPRKSEYLISLSSPSKPDDEGDLDVVVSDNDGADAEMSVSPPPSARLDESIDPTASCSPAKDGDGNTDRADDDEPSERELMQPAPSTPPLQPSTPARVSDAGTPASVAIKTITHTTTVPIHFSPYPAPRTPRAPTQQQQQAAAHPPTPTTLHHPPVEPHSPFPSRAFRDDGTLDREAALEQIRQRRGRARSVAMGYATPRRQVEDQGLLGRRDISAPVGEAGKAWTRA